MPLVLQDPFEGLLFWTPTTPASWSIAAGRNGNGVQVINTTDFLAHTLEVESADVTFGFAFQVSVLSGTRALAILRSDAGVTTHLTVGVNANGSIQVTRGTSGGTILGAASAAGLIAINTWNYVELQATLSDTVGKVELRLNGTVRVGPLTNQDTKNAGTKTVFDTLVLTNTSGGTSKWDDLYLKIGAGETFNGDTVVTAVTQAVVTKHSTRVAVITPGDAQNYRQSVRVAVRGATPEARAARFVAYNLVAGPSTARMAQASLRSLTILNANESRMARASVIALVSLAGLAVKVWDGDAFVDGPVKLWDGAAFVDAAGLKVWDGAAFV